ncbi:TPA: hypothetical protein H1009_01330, partial [archaeon]|nr:hypothetical protein [Candidatus Naiadarchaeales archaeon SRR2090153.bin461]
METRNKILFGIAIIFLIVIGAAAIDVYAQVNTTSGTPDLGVTDLAISNSNPQINEVFTVTFTVTNQGTADIDASKPPYSAGYYLYRSDSTHGDSITAAGTLRSLKVGESQTLSFQSSMYSSPTEIYVVIDRENQYAELNENNNKKSLIIYWPDLVVTGMKLYQSDLKIGDNSDGVATIKNIGIADTARAVSLRVYKTDSSGTTLLGTSTRSFRAGESFDVAIGGRIAYSPTTFKVVIDSENLVSESDESNNEGSLTVTAASSASSGGSGGGGTATNQTSGGSGGGGGTSSGSTGGGGGISEPKVLPIYLGPTLDVSTDKYYYTADEQVKVSAVLTGSASTIANAVVAAYVYYSPYCPEGAACAAVVITDKITFQLVGGVVQACEVQEGGITTCPTTQSSSSYYVGYYTPRGAGTYNIIGSARTSDHILAGDEAKFEVIGKAIDVTDYDAIDLSISPEEQKTIIGEPVTYVLTIRDKHKSPDCLRTEPRCLIAERLYTYNLELFGLPYPSSFSQSSVTLSAGQSTDVRLIVYPS